MEPTKKDEIYRNSYLYEKDNVRKKQPHNQICKYEKPTFSKIKKYKMDEVCIHIYRPDLVTIEEVLALIEFTIDNELIEN